MEIDLHLFCTFNLFNFNLYLNVGSESAQTEFGTCFLVPTFIQRKENGISKGSTGLNIGEPKSYYYCHYYDYDYFIYFILLLLKTCSPSFFLFFFNLTQARLK